MDEASCVVSGGVGIDSGGTLTKIVYFRPKNPPKLPDYVVFEEPQETLSELHPDPSLDVDLSPEGTLRFIKIPSSKNLDFFSFCKNLDLDKNYKYLSITGGGAFKFQNELSKLQTPVYQIDEMEGLVFGLSWLLQRGETQEVFQINSTTYKEEPCTENIDYPFMVANMGSGTSILRIDGPSDFVRVSGSSLGGGTFWGLSSLLTNAKSYPELNELAAKGDYNNVDLLVGDIYGEDIAFVEHLGLTADLLACSLGKITTTTDMTAPFETKQEDVAASLQRLITINAAQVVYLNAKVQNVKHIIFAGGFVQHTPGIKKDLDWGINYWSGGTMKALFVLHDGYLGALGALLHKPQKPIN